MGNIKNSYWLRSGLINIVQNFSGVFFSFGSFFFLVRVLDKHSFGAWTLFLTTVTLLEVVRGGLIQDAFTRFLASAKKEEHARIISAAFSISGVLTLFCILVSASLAPVLARIWEIPELPVMLYSYSLCYVFSGVLSLFNNIEYANLSFRGIFIANILKSGIFFLFVLICYLFNIRISLLSLVYVQTVGFLICAIAAYYHVKQHLRFSGSVSKDWVKKLLGHGKFSFGTSISSILSSSIDQLMLGGLISAAASGAFNIAVKITNIIDIPTNAMATIVFPQSARRMETEGTESIKYLYEKSVGTVLAILFPVVLTLFIFSDHVIYLVAGKNYSDSIPLLHVTLCYCLLIPFGRQFGVILSSIGKPKISFYIVVLTATLNLFLNYNFIRWYGVMGAAYATLLSNLIGFAIGQYILRRILGVNVLSTLTHMGRFYPEFYSRYVAQFFRSPHRETSADRSA